MYKLKFSDVLKYAFVKTILTCVLVVITNAFNKEGNQQMIGFEIFVAILSLGVYLLLLALRKVNVNFKNPNYTFLLIILALTINELIVTTILIDINIVTVITNGKSFQKAFKLCDTISVIFSSYIFLVLPVRNMLLKEKPGQK